MSPVTEEQEELNAPISISQTLPANIRDMVTLEAPVVAVGQNSNAPTGGSGGIKDPIEPVIP